MNTHGFRRIGRDRQPFSRHQPGDPTGCNQKVLIDDPPSRDQVLAASAGWVAVLLNVVPGLGAGFLYQRRWRAYWITSAIATAWFVSGAVLAGGADAAAEAQNQLVGLIGLTAGGGDRHGSRPRPQAGATVTLLIRPSSPRSLGSTVGHEADQTQHRSAPLPVAQSTASTPEHPDDGVPRPE